MVLVQHETEGVLLHIQVLVTSVNKSICSTVRSYCSWNFTSSLSFLLTEPRSVSCTDWLCVSWSNVWWIMCGEPVDASTAPHLESTEPYSAPAPRRWRSECKCRRRRLPGRRLQHSGGWRVLGTGRRGLGLATRLLKSGLWPFRRVRKHIHQIFWTLYVRGDQQWRSSSLISVGVAHQMECWASQTAPDTDLELGSRHPEPSTAVSSTSTKTFHQS